LALYDTNDVTLTGNGQPSRIRIGRATQSLERVLQVPPAVGRWFLADEATPGGPLVAVLSHGLWVRRYSGDQGILGGSIILDGKPTTVVGVMPPSFAFPDPQVQAWIPRQDPPAMVFDNFSFNAVARLRGSATLNEARAEISSLIARLPILYPQDPSTSGIVNRAKLMSVARTLKDAKVGRITRVLWVLLAAVAFVLLVACANAANLFLVRSDARQSEIAVRRALGAGRGALTGFFAAESALITAMGGVLGLALAWVAVRLLVNLSPSNLPRLEEVALDATAVLYCLMLIAAAAVAFSAIPVWRTSPAAGLLHGQSRGNTASRSRHRTRHLLMGAQVALALVLLVASSLMVRSFQKLRAIDPRFAPSSALTFRIGLPDREYPNTSAALTAHQTILDRVAALAGVTGVSASTRIPLADSGCGYCSLLRVEGVAADQGPIPPIVAFRAVSASYFQTMGTRLLRGRGIEQRDSSAVNSSPS